MELDGYFRFLLALFFVIGLIGVLALIARRAGLGFPARTTKTGNARRIEVIEVAPVDGRRRLVLVRRDNVEHLLLLSPTSELVVEAGITQTLLSHGPGESAAPSVDTADFRAALDDARNQHDPDAMSASEKPQQ